MSAAVQKAVEEDHRISPRERVMLVAKLSFNQGAVSVECVISNISKTGARLSVSADVVLSQTMRLSVPQRDLDVPVRLVWRRGNLAAVAFETAETASARVASATTREKSLEEENRRLRILLVEMEQRLKRMQEGA